MELSFRYIAARIGLRIDDPDYHRYYKESDPFS